MVDGTPTLDALRSAILSDTDLARQHEARRIKTMLDAHDAERAKSPLVKLIATTAFTLVDDENPEGRVVNMGEEFEVSEFDLPRYIGRGLRPAGDVAANAGPSVTVG